VPEPVEVLFCCDAAYLQHTAVAMLSMLENSRALFRVTVVGSRAIPPELEAKLRKSVARPNLASLNLAVFRMPEDLPANERLTGEAYLRLWIGRFYPETTRKVLYLDGDLVVLADVAELWNTELGECVVAAVPIPGSDRWRLHGTPEENGYFNSGVMLFDLRAWRAGGYEQKALGYVARHPDRMLDADQDALNPCLHDRWLRWPYEWNAIAAFFKRSHPLGLEEARIRQILREARIVHFNGIDKPWLYDSAHPAAGRYWTYLRRTEWRDYVPPNRTLKNRLKRFARRVLPGRLVRLLRGWSRS
jgi:lipopolysaccharide biosynthesis glycosyltransferase